MGDVTRATPISDFSFAGRRRTLLLIGAALTAMWWAAPTPADARPYTVYACDAAGFWGHATNAWAPLGTGTIEARCPSHGHEQGGMTTRLVGATYQAFTAAIYDFFAPPGTSITGLRWSGRVARNDCSWHARIAAYPSNATLVGVAPRDHCTSSGFNSFDSIFNLPVPPGTTHLRQMVACGQSNCPPGASFHSRHMEVILEDGWSPNVSVSGALAEGQWVGGEQQAHVRAEDNTGVRRIEGEIPGARSHTQEFACNPTFALPCPSPASVDLSVETPSLADGEHTLRVTVLDAAGNPATTHRTVRVDNTPPDPVVPAIAGGEAWRTVDDFDLQWTNPANQHAPITAVHWEICSEGRCVQDRRAGANLGELRDLAVARPGDHTARVWLEDAAGNARKEAAVALVHMRFDPVAPSVTFDAPDPADPLRVSAAVSDRHSGVAHGEIEIRREGTTAWHGLETRVDNGRLVAYVDDQRFRQGSYEFRAHVLDHAGNEASIGARDPGAATLRLPVRAATRLKAGVRRISMKRRVVRRHGRRHTIRRRVVSLDSRVRVPFRRHVLLHGRLTNGDGQPLGAATVDVFDDSSPRSRLLATVQADRDGWFSYRLRAKRNRLIRFRYGGSRRIGPAESRVRVMVPGTSSIRVSRSTVLNGESVLFRGKVKSEPLPAAGKLIEVQAHFRNRWRTFSTVRTDRAGRWRFTYQFGGTVGRVFYRFRVLLPVEGGYPFATGTSRVLRVLVIGL